MKYLISLLFIVLSLTAIGQGNSSNLDTFNLGITRLENGKLIFTLNGLNFLPVIMSCGINSTEDQIRKFRDDGFNIVYTSIDYPWIYSKDKDIKQFLDICNRLKMPVIIELA